MVRIHPDVFSKQGSVMDEREALAETLTEARCSLEEAKRSIEYLNLLRTNAERRVEVLTVLIKMLESVTH